MGGTKFGVIGLLIIDQLYIEKGLNFFSILDLISLIFVHKIIKKSFLHNLPEEGDMTTISPRKYAIALNYKCVYCKS